MKRVALEKKFIATLLLGAAFLAGCGDDDDFSPVSRNRGYDYAFTSTKDFADYPCNDVREGREAVVGRDKESYYCQFDYRDSVYIWAGYDDTLTAYGKEFVRSDASSSSRESSSSYDDDDDTRISRSSSSYSSSSYSSSRYSSSSYYSSSSRKKVDATPRLTEKGEQFNPAITYGTMTDSRDGKKYRTVTINGQTWMAENLNYTGNEYGQAFCYNDEEEFCELYGRLYTRDAALNSPDCPSGTYCRLGYGPLQGICPEDWHIPTVNEATLLMNYIGTDIIDWASAKSWKPEFFTDSIKDTYGLSFVPGGFHEDKGFRALDSVSFMWVYLPNDAQRYFVINANTDEIFIHTYSAYVSVPVRCVKGEMKPFSSSSYSSSSARSSSSSYSGPWSSENPSSSFSISSKEDLLNPSLTYGTMTDPRDGKKYKTIEFNGRIWMAENLNFSDSSIVPLLEGNNTCYHEKESECELFGRLYDRVAAMNDTRCTFNGACSLGSDPIQGICPSGWHVLTYDEATSMINLVGSSYAEKIMSAKGWGASVDGENTYGLSFIAPGTRDGGNYDSKGGYAYYWIYRATTSQSYFYINGDNETMSTSSYSNKTLSLPVRCIKDTPAATSSSSSSSSSVSSSSAKSSSSSYSSSSSARSSSSSVTLQPYSSSEPRKYTYKEATDAYTVTEPETRDGYFNPNIDYGTMTDPRDGKTYRTVEVLGRTWMAENLNYAGNTVGRSACYKDSNEMCDRYGRTYSRAAAMNVSTCAYTNYCDPGEEPVQGICPNGWHLPSTSEVWELVLREKGNATPFMSAYGWVDDPNAILPGENTYGLSFLGAGPKDKIGLYAFMWVSHYDDNQHYFIVQGQENHVLINNYGDYGNSEIYASVRCIKDE